jgi:hypothetical protein
MTPTQDPEQERKALQLAQAYQDVFGTDKDRDPSQRLVWDDLTGVCAFYKKTIRFTRDGQIDPFQTVGIEGGREVFLHIMAQIKLASQNAAPPTTVKVTRGRRKSHD